jgi:hypothetical protein
VQLTNDEPPAVEAGLEDAAAEPLGVGLDVVIGCPLTLGE